MMKLLRTFSLFFIIIVFTGSFQAFSVEILSNRADRNLPEIVPNFENFKVEFKNNNKLQEVNFRILDSLANAYSYFTNNQQPFVYYAPKNLLVTIKRGYHDPATEPGYSGKDTKDNLFFHTSTNLGVNWSAPRLIYDSKENTSERDYNARYPSIIAFESLDEMYYAYTSPATGGTGWRGFINGLADQSDKYISLSKTFKIAGQDYNWGGTDSKIAAGDDNGDVWAMAVGTIMPPGGIPLDITSNIGYRRTTDFTKWGEVIPPAWAANKYVTPTATTRSDSLRTSFTLGLRKIGDKLYMAADAAFLAGEVTDRRVPGVSISTDNGVTWSDYDIMPWSIITAYANSLGINTTAAGIGVNDFTVLDNGNYSFIASFNEDTTVTGTPYADAVHQIIEIYKEGNTWGVRKIANTSGYVLRYLGTNSNNQMGSEEQISRTVDGSALVAKWVDFVDAVDQQGNIIKNYTTDIIVCTREIGNDSWGRVVDITQSEIYDRITWIPDFVPNNLLNIPILKVESIPNPGDDPNAAAERQRQLETVPQYVLTGNFDGTISLSADDTKTADNGDASILSTSPNPAYDYANVEFIIPSNGYVTIELFDLMGNRVSNIANEYMSGGLHSIKIDTRNISSGSYFIRLKVNGQSSIKNINVLR